MSEATHPVGMTEERAGEPSRPFYKNPYLWGFLIGITMLTLMRPFLRFEPAPPPVLGQLPAFRLVDANGRDFGSEQLSGRVYVANFIFTRCTSICPLLTQAMSQLQTRYEQAGVDVALVSFTVDPEYDTPERLQAYGAAHGVDPERWEFLTGQRDRVRDLVVNGFKTPMGEAAPAGESLVDIAHTGKLVLVDGRGGLRGYYDSDAAGIDEVFHRSQHVLAEARH